MPGLWYCGEIMTDFNDLKPGYYLQVGDKVTALKSVSDATWQRLLTGERENSLERLASSVGWVFIALSRRREQLGEIPLQWRLNGDDIEGEPYTMRQRRLMAQTDTALQVHGVAYWHKLRMRGGGIEIRWLDPATMEPDYDHLDEEGNIAWYWRSLDTGRIRLPAEDVVRFTVVGLRELEPGPSAMHATRVAANLLYGADLALASLFGNNALPIFLIKVPAGTSEHAKEELKSGWRRMLNPKRRGSVDMRSTAVSADVAIEKLSLSPSELAIDALEDRNRDEILAAHGVPQSQVMGNASNFATADIDKISFIGTMTSRVMMIADELAHDPDFGGRGYELVPLEQQLIAVQERRLNMIQGLTIAVQAGIMTVNEARDVLDLEEITLDTDAAMPEEPQPTEEPPAVDGKAWAWQDEASQFRRWYKKRNGADVAEFNANHLTYADKLEIAAAVDGYSWHDYP